MNILRLVDEYTDIITILILNFDTISLTLIGILRVQKHALNRIKRSLLSSGWHSFSIFDRSRIQISARGQAILTEIFSGSSQSL
jgi:hypothetical protein